ncbi:MAG: tetratricopeptide repeat protein [Spirochaetales bacterium]|nr:tetratricopeptide repeat protein [Spirochaetales bacterium]
MKNKIHIFIVLLSLIFAGFFAGCKTTPKEIKTEEVKQPVKPVNPAITEAEKLLKKGSYESIIEAVKKLKDENLLKDPKGAEIAYLSREIYKLIYPELKSKFPPIDTIEYSGTYRRYFGIVGKAIPLEASTDYFNLMLPGMVMAGKHQSKIDKSYLEELKKSLVSAIDINPDAPIPYYLLALTEEALKNTDNEINNLKKSIKTDRNFYPAEIRLAQLYINGKGKNKNFIEGSKLLETAASIIPPNADVQKMLAEAYYSLKEYGKAEASSANALLLKPKREDLVLLRAKILKASGKWQQALRMYNLALKFAPEQRDALLAKGEIIFYNENNLTGSLDILNSGEKAYPKDPSFPELKGRILLEAGKDNEGLKELNNALELQPGRISTLRMLLQNSISMNRWIQGAIYLSQILEQSSSEEDLKLAYTVFKNLGDTGQALTYAERLYKLGTDEEYTGFYIEQLYTSGKMKEALKLITENLPKIRSRFVKSDLYLYKAKIIEKSDKNEALTALRKAIMLYPDNLKAIIKISQLYSNLHMYRRAGLYLKHAVQLDPNNPGLKIQLKQVMDLYSGASD